MTDDDTIFDLAGGFTYADELADGMEARAKRMIRSTGKALTGVILSTAEVLFLVDAYRRLREADRQTIGDEPMTPELEAWVRAQRRNP